MGQKIYKKIKFKKRRRIIELIFFKSNFFFHKYLNNNEKSNQKYNVNPNNSYIACNGGK